MEGTYLVRKLLVIGSSGQLASAIRRFRPDSVFLERRQLDLSEPDTISDRLKEYAPDMVINAAAYTQVDNAEKEEKLIFNINAKAPEALAYYCASRNIPFIHFSTDYVFNGSKDTPWNEEDATAPLNAYGRSKAAGEKYIADIGGKYLLFRTSWMYDAQGRNFLNTILKLAKEREELRIIDDQFGAPTYAPHLAKAVLSALEIAGQKPAFPSGIYHLCNFGYTTWYGFAVRIIEIARACGVDIKMRHIYPIPASEYPLPAKRPTNSRLDCSKAQMIFNISMPDWHQGLEDCMREKYENI